MTRQERPQGWLGAAGARFSRAVGPVPAARHLPWLVAGLLSLGLLAELVSLGIRVRASRAPRAPAVAAPPAVAGLALTPALAALFGAKAVAAPAADVPVDSLTLTAVIATSDPAEGLGIIGPKGAATAVYRVGADVPGGGRLIEVYVDHVVMDNVGERRTLWLPRTVLTGTAAAPTPVETRAAALGAATGNARLAVRKREALREQIVAEIGTTKGHARDWWAAFHADPTYGEKGKFLGLRVLPPAEAERAGLQTGDFITAVDGVAVTDSEQALHLLAARYGGSATVAVTRDGQPMTFVIQVKN